MSNNNSSIVGSIVERKTRLPSTPTLKSRSLEQVGFPVAQHRSKSAFTRNRELARATDTARRRDIPTLVTQQKPKSVVLDDWREQISRENELRVEHMTEEEREKEKQEIIARFGPDVADILRRARLARDKQPVEDETQVLAAVPMTSPAPSNNTPNGEMSPMRVSSPPPALSTCSTRPSSRTDRRLRFAELTPENVHVYESAPPSPKRKPLALPPPSGDDSTISLGQWRPSKFPRRSSVSHAAEEPELEEGTSEYIRRRYFPNAPKENPGLSWMNQAPFSDPDASPSLRFDLSGKPIPPSVAASLPTHLGLHHHAEGASAGYTLDDILLLSRSTVPAQRATMLAVLARIVQRLAKPMHGEVDGMEDLNGKEEELRKNIMAAGVEAMTERGSVGARAVEVVWQCIVAWDEDLSAFGGVELEVPDDATLKSLQLDCFLPRVCSVLRQGDLAEESRMQLLSVLIRLAQQSNEDANLITTSPKLIETIVQTFLLTSTSPTDSSPNPFPLAIDLLSTLAQASRSNAWALREAADAALRFVAILPSASIYPTTLATSLLVSTLRFYRTLASYGLYSHIASTAMTEFQQLGKYILSDACNSRSLMTAWMNLLESWIICAVDPHKTTPEHDILWSQIVAWGWNGEVNELKDRLGADEGDWDAWGCAWKVNAAWLEGSRVNAPRCGSTERARCLETFRSGFENGNDNAIVMRCLDAIKSDLQNLASVPFTRSHLPHLQALEKHAAVLAYSIRLWLACLPPLSDGPLESPPFSLPFSSLSELSAKFIVHPVWSLLKPSSKDRCMNLAHTYLRSSSSLLCTFIRLSKRLPNTSQTLWSAQALSILTKVLPGDEEFSSDVLEAFSDLLTPEWITSLDLHIPSPVWAQGGISMIKPFLAHVIRPQDNVYIGPLAPTPKSISCATTQRIPSTANMRLSGLPLPRDWTLAALDHLLRSGTSEVFKSLPPSWDASEVEIVRASLSLTLIVRRILTHFALLDFTLSREEAILGCMKVFMLEHGQSDANLTEEVFRDPVVEKLMDGLLKPFTYSVTREAFVSKPVVPLSSSGDLEQVAAKFLGQTPFFQYYTDFVSLYDAISFSHPLFSRLLLPPVSMKYANDYRRFLWNDYGHLIKTIRTPIDQVLTDDLQEYLWPLEKDPQVTGAYLRSILQNHIQGFAHLVALHHIACNIWADDEDGWSEEHARKLLSAVVVQGGREIVREVVLYRQSRTSDILEPPQCFMVLDEGQKSSRLQLVTRWGLAEQVRGLLGITE